jgi:DNA modification methylase
MQQSEKELLKLIKIKNEEISALKKELNCLREVSKTDADRDKEKDQRKKTFNGMTAKEWTVCSKSVWDDVSSARKKQHLIHGATFPQKLAERVISMYSKEKDLVFDPFVGTGTTMFAAEKLSRDSVGIELNDEFIKYIYEGHNNSIFTSNVDFNVLKGDCIEEINKVTNSSIQLTFTSPPYADLLLKVEDDRKNRHKHSRIVEDNNSTAKPYSADEKDFGNMALKEYSDNVLKLMKKIYKKTKDGGYNIWVVKDFRDVKNGIPYINLHGLIATLGEKAGFKYHDLIIWDQNEQRSLVLLGYPSVFYINQNHSYLVVLRK